MDKILETNFSSSTYPGSIFVYTGIQYQDSFTANQVETELTIIIDIESTDSVLIVSPQSIISEKKSYRENSRISPQDCHLCQEKYQFGNNIIPYHLTTMDVRTLYETIDDQTKTDPTSQLLHSICDTFIDTICQDCMKHIKTQAKPILSHSKIFANQL